MASRATRADRPTGAVHRVVVAGATGLVGRECVRAMLADPAFHVVALVRRADAFAPQPRLTLATIDYERLDATAAAALGGCDALLSALGTTIRTAGSQPAFRRVDHDYPLELARLGRAAGVGHFGLVSALGADAGSRVFYNRVKGETERDVLAVGYRSVAIVRPSLLLGDRDEVRPAEALGRLVGVFAPAAWRPVHARDVAGALVRRAAARRPGVEIVENAALRREAHVMQGGKR
jgi:uncharacterized protein YbjT (DUF2867 family)